MRKMNDLVFVLLHESNTQTIFNLTCKFNLYFGPCVTQQYGGGRVYDVYGSYPQGGDQQDVASLGELTSLHKVSVKHVAL